MFDLKYSTTITITDIPIQWIPKIELYYPDLPQFPIMYIHVKIENERLIACPVSVSYEIKDKYCNAHFLIFCNINPINNEKISVTLEDELRERIGIKNKVSLDTIINCCNGNKAYENLMTDLWQYVEKSYGSSIPYGRFFEEIYSIARFVSAWLPKTGRQSEMRMLYNFMSAFGQEVKFPPAWSHLEYYVIPTYDDVRKKDYSDFPIFKKLYIAIKKLFDAKFTNEVVIENVPFKVLRKAWKQNKNDFITDVSTPLYASGVFTDEDKFYAEMLVDAFNRNSWRAAYFISAFLNIEHTDYKKWTKSFFSSFYDNGSSLRGYSEKVMACFLQQGFGNEEIIPIDTWIETFYYYPLGIGSRAEFYDSFSGLGKMERVIWLASQSNKTNMKNFFDILWCQRYGVIGNKALRGVNPLACYSCKLNKTCVGVSKALNELVYLEDINNIIGNDFSHIPSDIADEISFICLLEDCIPRKVYKKYTKKSTYEWYLVDEFSGYLMTKSDSFSSSSIKQTITVLDFLNH